MCLDIELSNYLKAMFKKLAIDDSCLRPGGTFKVGREHGDVVDRSCAGGGEGRVVKPCYLFGVRAGRMQRKLPEGSSAAIPKTSVRQFRNALIC